MKHNFVRMKTRAKSVSLRTLALVMGVVMLLSAIGVGSTLSAYAVSADESTQSGALSADESRQSGALSAAAVIGSNIADRVALFNDSLVAEANAALRGDKADLADTSAKAELAKIGDGDTYYMHIGVQSDFRTSDGIAFTYDANKGLYYASYDLVKDKEYPMVICTTSGALGDGQKSSSNQSVTTKNSTFNPDGIQFDYFDYNSNNYDGYDCFKFKTQTSQKVYFTFTSLANGLVVRSSLEGVTPVTPTASTKVYFVKPEGWGDNVFVHFYNSSNYWDNDKGTGSQTSKGCLNINNNSIAMTVDSEYPNYYSADLLDNTQYVAFTNLSRSNYEYFWGGSNENTDGLKVAIKVDNNVREGFSSATPVYTPSGSTTRKNGSDYYLSGTWSALPEEYHDVTFSQPTGGTIKVNGSSTSPVSVNKDATYTVTLTPNPGYQVDTFKVGGVDKKSELSSNSWTGTMGSANIAITATFSKVNYRITKGAETNGTFTVSPATAQIGDTVTISNITPAKGYIINSVSTTPSTTVTGSGSTRTFTMPGSDVTVNVSFTDKTNNAISRIASPGGGGTVYVGSSNASTTTGTLATYTRGNTRYARAEANAAYDFDKIVVTYANGDTVTESTNPYVTLDTSGNKFSDENDGSISVTAYFTKKPTHSVTVVSNNKVLGKATSSVTNAYSGQSVTINAIEETGTFSAWSKNPGAAGTIANTSNASTTFTMGDTDVILTATFTAYSGGNSDYYYNSYDSSTGDVLSGDDVYGVRMKNAKINGSVYSYAHINNRTGNTQTFTISHYSPIPSSDLLYWQRPNSDDNWSNNQTQYAKFFGYDGVELYNHGWDAMSGSGHSVNSNYVFQISVPYGARYVQFYDGKSADNGYHQHTWKIDLTTKLDHNEFYYSGDKNGYGEYQTGDYKNTYGSNPINTNFHEYFWGDSGIDYSNSYSTNGFQNHNQLHNFAKPDNLGSNSTDYYILLLYANRSYTINNVTLTPTKNTVIWTSSLPQPEVEPDGTTRVTLYAKNGTLRDSTFNRFTNLADTQFEDYFSYSERTDSGVITYNSYAAYNAAHPDAPQISIEHNVSFGNSSYDIMYNVPVGAKVKVTTELSPNGETFRGTEKFSDTHYLKAYSFNGMTYKVFTKNDGVATTNGKKFTEEWTVRAVNTVRTNDDGTTTALTRTLTGTGDASVRIVEITPIYYMQDNTNCKTFYIDGYDGTVQQAWGNMLAVYPYYEGKSNSENAFGGYPGQPMLFWGGKYQMEIPLTVDGTANGATVKGLTLHNGYWDLLHRSVDLICNEHAQTYDFDDFYKIYKEKNPDSIIFDFKYRTTEDNYNDGNRDDYGYYKFAGTAAKGASDFDGDSHNGVELLTDYYGRPVDVFGKVLSESQRSTWSDTGTINHTQTKELLLVSNGYKHTYTGWYATMYAVYAPASNIPSESGDTAKKFIGYITPSMLYLNNIGRVAQYGADTTGGLDMTSTDPNMQNTYNHLKKYYSGVPAVIAYEKEILNDSRDQAKRSDGKWYYSNNTDQITANITIQYIDNETDVESVLNSANHGLTSDKWTNEETYTAGLNDNLNVGSHSKCTAYFTNTNPYLLGKVNSGLQFADSTKFFTFKAQAAGKYMFVGWVRERNGQYYSISDEEIGTSSMSANDHYIARFVKTTSGALTVSHNVEQTSQYTGKGTPYLTVTVLNGSDEEVFSQTVNDGSKIDVTDYITTKYNDFKINISLSTAPDVASESMMQEYVAPVVSGIGSIASTTPAPVAGSTATTTATVAEFTVSQLLALTGDNEISSLNYISHLSVPSYSYKYEIKYNYTSRFWGEQSYTATGTILSTDIEGMQNVTGSKLSAGLTDEFIENKTPFEKNLNQTITWKYGEKTKETTKDSTWTQENQVFLIKYEVGTDQVVNDRVSAEFKLPYPYDPATYEPIKVDAYNGTGNDATPTGNSDYVYDDRNDTVKLSTKAYHLFTTNGTEVQGGDNVHANGLPLLQAAPYIIKGAEARIANKLTLQYFTGTRYTVDGQTGLYFVAKNESGEDTCYWYNVEPGAAYTGSANRVQLKESDVVYADTITGIPAHTYAVKGKFNNQDVVYYFDPDTAEKGQYNMHYFTDQIEGYKDGTGTKYYFTRWDIRNSKGDYIASSYLSTFNYSGYEDYSVEAIYDSLTPNPETDADVEKVPTISYIGDSRNQWNTVNNVDGSGNVSTVLNKSLPNGDVLFHDFAISYDYYGEEIAKINSSDKVIRIGMLIEQVGALESVDGSKITDASYYADKYKDDYDAAALKNALESNRNPRSETGHITVNSKIGNNANNNWGQKFGTGSAYNPFGFSDVIDNMNRLQWYYTFDNNKDGENNFKNANYVYRASAYIIEGPSNGATATLSSTPVYFTLYDSARR